MQNVTTAIPAPDWLTRHDGTLAESKDGRSWSVHFAGQLQYLLIPVPAKGKYACRITQTINGRRLDGPAVWPTPHDAVRGGLEELRAALGW